jgi:hypothetical protein
MSLKAKESFAIPEETVQVVREAFPKGNRCLSLREELRGISDSALASLFDPEGRSAVSSGQLV